MNWEGKRVSFVGYVESVPEGGRSAKGTDYARFVVRSKDSIFNCVCFKQAALRAASEVEVGKEISVQGTYKDPFAEQSKEVLVSWFHVRGVGGDSSGDPDDPDYRIKRFFGTREKARAEFDALRERRETQGYCLCRVGREREGKATTINKFYPKSECIDIKGKPYPIIEWLMDTLGAKHVSEILSVFFKKLMVPGFESKKEARVGAPKKALEFPSELYKQTIDTLITEALAKEYGQQNGNGTSP
jgi:hypothetical protein